MNPRFLLRLALVAGLAISAPTLALAAKTKPPATPAATPETGRSVPYHGKVTVVDAAAKTFSIKGKEKDRVFATTEETVIIGKDGAPATLASIPVGEEVRGSAMKSGDTWTAKKVTLGVKDAATPRERQSRRHARDPRSHAEKGHVGNATV